jgi:tetratricopeptide (TPR) repeat protein
MRKPFFSIVCFTALLLLGYSGYRSYQTWKQKHLMSMAREFAAASDMRSAQLSLTELLRINPQNIEASRFMADVTEPDQKSASLFWRKHVVALDPHSTNDRLALAAIAIKMHDLKTAADALEGIEQADRNTAAFHSVAGDFYAAAGKFAAAEGHFREAMRLEPQNLALELGFAVVCLHDTNGTETAEARNMLNQLSVNQNNPALRCQAIRELTIDALHNHQKNASLTLSRRLVQETNSIFTDRLLRLEALREAKNDGFNTEMAALQREAQNDTTKIEELTMWQFGKIPALESLTWLRSLPMSTQTNKTVALLKSECCVELQDWRGLQACVEKGNWGELEPVRHAFKCRALRGQGLNDAAVVEWKQALQTANNQEPDLVMLLRLAVQWNWLSEGESILQTIVDEHPNDEWARQSLARALFASGQTRSLMQLYNQEATRSPSDLMAKNNVAMTALLLNEQELKPHQIALELYQESPTNSYFAATYAFSLYQQGKKAEALNILNRLGPQQLENVTVAACYGLLLEATGNRKQAKRYLDLASKTQMLPEERALIDNAKRDLDRTGAPRS